MILLDSFGFVFVRLHPTSATCTLEFVTSLLPLWGMLLIMVPMVTSIPTYMIAFPNSLQLVIFLFLVTLMLKIMLLKPHVIMDLRM